MSLNPIKEVIAEKIIREIQTKGSGPLLVLANDGNSYFCKTTTSVLPAVEVINEVFVAYIAKCWKLNVPEIALVNIPNSVIDDFKNDGTSLSERYINTKFDESIFFGSQQEDATELECYIDRLTKSEFRNFKSPTDIIKIGILDMWIGNKDRHPNNPNIIITSCDDGTLNITPIDHAASFAYCVNYQQVSDVFLFLEEKSRILKAPLIKSIATFASPEVLEQIEVDVLTGIKETIENLDFIFEQIPAKWGFSKKAKMHLKTFLSDDNRNKKIAKSYYSYLK